MKTQTQDEMKNISFIIQLFFQLFSSYNAKEQYSLRSFWKLSSTRVIQIVVVQLSFSAIEGSCFIFFFPMCMWKTVFKVPGT